MKQIFEVFNEAFKVMLVKRYNWSVTDAAGYEDKELRTEYEKGLSPQEAYYIVFDIELGLKSGLSGQPAFGGKSIQE